MTVGDILDRGLKLLFARLPAYYGINLLVLSPLILVQVAVPFITAGGGGPADPAAAIAGGGVMLLAVVISLILQPIATAAILHIVMHEYHGKQATVGEAFAFALTRFLGLIGTSLLVLLVLIVAFICFCLPCIYFAVIYSIVAQVVVLEKLSGTQAMSRCQQLIAGYWGRVFGILFLTGLANAIINFALGLGLESVMPSQNIIPAANGVRFEVNATNHIIKTLVTQLVQILFATFISICTTLLYLDLRIRKEGYDIEMATNAGGDEHNEYRREDPPEEARW